MSFLAILAPAWVPSEFNYRWSLPSDPLSDEGLGGGITWALDPSKFKLNPATKYSIGFSALRAPARLACSEWCAAPR